ncbi:MAG: phosphopantetheine-binding protein [Bacteroidales bacterium]|nr:phosphopantetheine-binding protein [Bacteroidales bacterium]
MTQEESKKQEELIDQLKAQIIEAVSLDDLTPADIDADAPLFVEGLGLDSIDAIELILLLDKKYGVKIEDPQQRKSALKSIRTMAELIAPPSPPEGGEVMSDSQI